MKEPVLVPRTSRGEPRFSLSATTYLFGQHVPGLNGSSQGVFAKMIPGLSPALRDWTRTATPSRWRTRPRGRAHPRGRRRRGARSRGRRARHLACRLPVVADVTSVYLGSAVSAGYSKLTSGLSP